MFPFAHLFQLLATMRLPRSLPSFCYYSGVTIEASERNPIKDEGKRF